MEGIPAELLFQVFRLVIMYDLTCMYVCRLVIVQDHAGYNVFIVLFKVTNTPRAQDCCPSLPEVERCEPILNHLI